MSILRVIFISLQPFFYLYNFLLFEWRMIFFLSGWFKMLSDILVLYFILNVSIDNETCM